jgi:choline dehydrogenase
MAPAKIQNNFLQTETDRRVLRDCVKMTRDIVSQTAFEGLRGAELVPGESVKTDDEIDAFVRQNLSTVFHPLGTCKMGIDEEAVVDPDLKVRGVQGLRVVDASVMPDLVGGNINAPVIMIAEKAADIILGAAKA